MQSIYVLPYARMYTYKKRAKKKKKQINIRTGLEKSQIENATCDNVCARVARAKWVAKQSSNVPITSAMCVIEWVCRSWAPSSQWNIHTYMNVYNTYNTYSFMNIETLSHAYNFHLTCRHRCGCLCVAVVISLPLFSYWLFILIKYKCFSVWTLNDWASSSSTHSFTIFVYLMFSFRLLNSIVYLQLYPATFFSLTSNKTVYK